MTSFLNAKCVYSSADTKYALRSLVSVAIFMRKNPDYDGAVLGTKFEQQHQNFAEKHGIRLLEIDLSHDFTHTWGKYPVECFYLLAGPKYLREYKVAVYIDGDVFCNRKISGIDFNSTKFLQCTFAATLIPGKLRGFKALQRDAETINKLWPNANWSRGHPQSGVVFFNVQRANEISFYESAVELYQKSLRAEVPRKGDDSLLSLWYLVTPRAGELYPLSKLYNSMVHRRCTGQQYHNFGSDLISDSFLFHCIGPKPWHEAKILSAYNYTYKHFVMAWQEEACRLLSHEQLVDLLPNFDVKPVEDSELRAYWYGKVSNFGDFITQYFLKKLCGLTNPRPIEPKPSDQQMTIVSTGSIYRLVNERAVVYGTGIRDRRQDIKRSHMIRCVRGPLTRDRALEIGDECPPIYGDPAMLLPRFYKPLQTEKKYSLGIIPHISQYRRVSELYAADVEHGLVTVIDLRSQDVEGIVDQIAQCEKTVSSSLHGIIVCHAYGVPVKWIKFDDNIKGDDTKFYDHFRSMGLDKEFYIDGMTYKRIPINVLIEMVHPVQIKLNSELLYRAMFFDENGIKPFTKYVLAGAYL